MKTILSFCFIVASLSNITVEAGTTPNALNKDKLETQLVDSLNKLVINGRNIEITDCPSTYEVVTRDLAYQFTYDFAKNALMLTASIEVASETIAKRTNEKNSDTSSVAYTAIIPMATLNEIGQTSGFMFEDCAWEGPMDATFFSSCNCMIRTEADGTLTKDKMLSVFFNPSVTEAQYQELNDLIKQLKLALGTK